jgi:mannose-6-phosphate isomerase-like protein (cupin superfamily)
MERRELAGGCTVLEGVGALGPGVHELIGAASGARHLAQYLLVQRHNPPPILAFGKTEAVVFVLSGAARAVVSGQPFTLKRETGLSVRPGEAFQLTPEKGKLLALITICPELVGRDLPDMPAGFDAGYPARTAAAGPGARQAMGDRFYQVLISKPHGATGLTQFIGEIPKSKAPAHHHYYEEAICVLSGEGRMWTGDKSASLARGAVIFLPKGQEHSLECTSDPGLRVVGHFSPAGSPAENY